MPTKTETKTIWVCEECEPILGHAHYIGSIASDGICARCGGLAYMIFNANALEPRLDRYGPNPRTIYDIVPRYQHVWDVNLFYRDLGVDPRATRLELRRAYQRLNGPESDRLTYIIKFLLNEPKRSHYDRLTPGEWIFDPQIEESVRRKAMRDAMDAFDSGEITPDDLTESMDFSDLRDQVVDNNSQRDKNDRRPGPRFHFEWRSYLWRAARDEVKLQRWQELLLESFARYEEVTEFAVGLAGDGMASPWLVAEIGPLLVIFLDVDEAPTRGLAQQAVFAVSTNRNRLTLESQT